MLLYFSFIEPNKGHVGGGKGTEILSWLPMCDWDTVPNTLVTFQGFNIIDLSIHIRNRTHWNGLRSCRLEVFIDSLAFFWCMLIAPHQTKTWYRLGNSSLCRSIIIGKILLEKISINLLILYSWQDFHSEAPMSCPRTCNNFLSKWHVTSVLPSKVLISRLFELLELD